MNPRGCWLHRDITWHCQNCRENNPCCTNPHCICGGNMPETPEPAPFVTPENRMAALRALDKAVKHARRMGLEVTCEAREVITTTL